MSELKVRDLMTTQVVTLRAEDTIKKAVLKFALDNISGAPVVDNRNHLLGILSENDILNLILRVQKKVEKEDEKADILNFAWDADHQSDPELKGLIDQISNTLVSEVMTKSVLITTPDTTVMEALKAMISMNVNRMPVVEKGVVVGIVSRGDIIFALYKRKV